MVLYFSELLGLLFELVELIEGFCLYFFEGIELACWYVDCLIYFGVLFAGAKNLQLLEVGLSEHL